MAQARPANRERTGRPEPPVEHRFKPGQSGNPSGRPKGIARTVREVVPAEDLVAFYRAVWAGDDLERWHLTDAKITLADRLKAGEWLSERGYGKAPIHAPVEGGDPLDRDEVDRAVDEAVDELAARREAPAPGPAEVGVVAGPGQAGTAPA